MAGPPNVGGAAGGKVGKEEGRGLKTHTAAYFQLAQLLGSAKSYTWVIQTSIMPETWGTLTAPLPHWLC